MLQAVLTHAEHENLQRLIEALILFKTMRADSVCDTCNGLFGTVVSAKNVPALLAMVLPTCKKIKLELALLTSWSVNPIGFIVAWTAPEWDLDLLLACCLD